MPRAAALAILAVGLGLVPGPARAEEPYFDFVRGLRQQGMADLAVDYLQRLSARPPAGLKDVLPLELAKARIDLATQEGNVTRRAAQFAAARAAYETFLKDHPNHPRAIDARLDLARLVALQGKLLLVRARRQESAAARRDLIAQARPLFAEAAARLKATADAIDRQLLALVNPTTPADRAAKEALTRAKLQAQLEEGINLLNQGNAFLDAKEVKQRAAVIQQAQRVFTKLANLDPDDPVGWQAKLWLGRLADETDNRPEARKVYEALAAEKNPAAEEAARTASYLLLRLQALDLSVPNRAAHVQQVIAQCEDWLKRQRSAGDSADAQGVRFVLATLLEEQARPGVTRPAQGNAPPRVSATARQQLARAERLLKDIAEGDNEFTDKARSLRAGILVVLMAERAKEGVDRLASFEECYLTAQVEAYDLSQGKLNAGERSRKLARILAALRRGLALAGRNDRARDVADARVMLAYTYLLAGEPYAAAILGEHLGRNGLAGGRSPDAAAYALQGYAAIVALDREHDAPEAEVRSDQRRLRALAEYMEKTWPDEPATDFARHQLGAFLLDDANFPDAIAMLARIAPSYPGLAQARYQEGAAAQKAQNPAVKLPAAQKKALLKKAITDLEAVPDPAPGASEETTLAACLAKLQLGNLLLLDEQPGGGNFARAEALGKRLAQLTPSLALGSKFAAQVAAESAKLQMAGTQGRAYLLAQADKIAEARELLAPLVAQVRRDAAAGAPSAEPWAESVREVQRQVLLLALRVAILDGKSAEARQALDLLHKVAAGTGTAEDRLLRVVLDLKREADALKAKGDAGRRDQLEQGLAGFLDELAQPNDLSLNARVVLAQAYAGLERHDRAAALLQGVAAPAATDADAVKLYRAARLLLAREYRLARQFAEAKRVLDEALASWGKSNLDVRKEEVQLMEDAGNLAGAFKLCRDMQAALKQARTDYERAVQAERAADEAERVAKTEEDRRKAQDEASAARAKKDAAQPLRDAYWEFYFYEMRVVLKNDLKRAKDAADRDRRLGVIAQAIKRLEDGQEDFGGQGLRQRYQSLLESEPLLKKKYVETHGKRLLDGDRGQ